MKKVLLLLSVIALVVSSCYTSNVYHGTVTKNTPQVEIASKRNHIFLWGLLSTKADQKASDIVGEKTNYTTQNTWTFVDGLLNVITCGIYSPTTTKFYAPWSGTNE